MNSEKICLIDVDWVVLDLGSEWVRRYNLDWGDSLTLDKITGWNIDQFVLPQCGKKIYEYLEQPDLYENVEIVDGAKEGIEKLREMGFRCVFASAGLHLGKPSSLRELGVLDDKRNFVAIEDKSLLNGRYIIDDKWETINSFQNGIGILYDVPHNRQYMYGKRAYDWKHVVQLIKRSEGLIDLFEMNSF